MAIRIEIGLKRGVRDARGRRVVVGARQFLRLPVESCRTRDVYRIDIPLSPGELQKIKTAFTDPVVARAAVGRLAPPDFDWMIEVGFKPGVTDNVGNTARALVQDFLDRKLAHYETVYTSIQYFLKAPELSREQACRLAGDLLANPLIHTIQAREDGAARPRFRSQRH
jgi:phosphoribosylformylglycinamidine (FGAM) synthase PurS component